MTKILASYALLVGLAFVPMSAGAHCDSADGPVATAAIRALDSRNANLILPFATAQAEPELSATFKQAHRVREKGPEALATKGDVHVEAAATPDHHQGTE
jgi:hypothetical protein